jgi:hypothetical protein
VIDIYVSGWYFRVPNLTKKYQNYFIQNYRLKEKYIKGNKLLEIINNLKNEGQYVIGVHIRRGDYKYWQSGRYYFDDCVYLKYMRTIGKDIETIYKKRYSFIIFSNENTSFNDKNNIYKSKNKWYIDHYLMSKCDFLIGPPSTFTMWASYVGKVKYFHIQNESGKIDLNDFILCEG